LLIIRRIEDNSKRDEILGRLADWENGRLFGLLNMALADGYIAMAATKTHYNYWRPVTAIQTGETDGNPDTTGDPAWTPLRPTPANQVYASGHSIEGGRRRKC
jgi:hypothetical protein